MYLDGLYNKNHTSARLTALSILRIFSVEGQVDEANKQSF